MKTSKQLEPFAGQPNFQVSCSVLNQKKNEAGIFLFSESVIFRKIMSCSQRPFAKGLAKKCQSTLWQLTFYRDVVQKPLRRASFGRFGQISGAIGIFKVRKL